MNGQKIDLALGFAAEYSAHATVLPVDKDEKLHFPGPGKLEVTVEPDKGSAWIGIFAGDIGQGFVDGLFATPDPRTACVAANGRGYLVEAADPVSWISVECEPIRHVLQITELGLIVFADFVQFIAYGFDPDSADIRLDVVWRSGPIGSDEVGVSRVEDGHAIGTVWDAARDEIIEYQLNLRTGRTSGR